MAFAPKNPNPEDPSTWMTYDEYLKGDRGTVPDLMWERGEEPDPGVMHLDPSCFYSTEYFDREVERLWKRAWLVACRENDIPNVGDWVEFSIAGQSLLIVRDGIDSIRALRNACRHRGTKVAKGRGSASGFTCPFHGWTYSLDGKLEKLPCEWDFPGENRAKLGLTPVSTGLWDGWVFINLDSNPQTLGTYLGPVVPRHFARYKCGEKWKRIHFGVEVPCNWKIVAEAFMETYHIPITHPTLRFSSADVQTRYDLFGLHSRLLEPNAAPCVQPEKPVTDAEIVNATFGGSLREAKGTPDNRPAREQVSDAYRAAAKARGVELDYSDAEMLDSMLYVVFPNFFPWAGTLGLNYRFRPNGLDPESSIFEFMILDPLPAGQSRPADTPVRMLKREEKLADYDDVLMGLGRLLDQDLANCGRIQESVRSLNYMILSHRQEQMIRRFHTNLERFMASNGRPISSRS